MQNLKLTGKELRSIGYPEGPVISIAIEIMDKQHKFTEKEEVMNLLKQILANPVEYGNDAVLGLIAARLLPTPTADDSLIDLNGQSAPLRVFGAEHIEQGAMEQIQTAVRLPVSVAGALMPDAHAGYGLPIGGVLATENAVIPYGVGVDIGCRMYMSVYDIDPKELTERTAYYTRELNEATLFGAGRQFDRITEHAVLDRKEFDEIPMLKSLQAKAARQLGSSGSGNHFVEFGIVTIDEKDPVLGLEPGKYLGLLSHSGSRGLGANIANHYTRIAKEKTKLPGQAANLAWLDMNEEAGIEYWLAMNLAGDYASACHHAIHEKITKQLGRQPIARVENHHNFAWKEKYDGKDVIVHRKGATPAGKDLLGIIPGSMTAPGFIVKGKGDAGSLASASHGAGRKMSRTAALKSVSKELLKQTLLEHGVKLLGGGLDEAPQAYKDIEVVMQSQTALVDVLGKFKPVIVKMDS